MKKYVVSFLAIVLPVAIYCQGNMDLEKEKAAIRAVIEQESNAYLDKDYESFIDTYVQNDPFKRFNSGANGFGGWNEFDWQSYDSAYNVFFTNNPDPLTNKFEFVDYTIRIGTPESAWAVYRQNAINSEGTQTGWTIQTRFLEKKNGKWKISYMSQIGAASYEAETTEE